MIEVNGRDVAVAAVCFALGVLFVRLRDLLQPHAAPGPPVPYADPVSGHSNRPRPATWFANARGERLYYELRGPAIDDPACKGLLFVNVGYSAHCMRPHTGQFLDALATPTRAQEGWCVASFDWAGSGYSQGVRCLYDDSNMVADLLQFVELVLGGDAAAAPPGQKPRPRQGVVPWVLCGHSRGGAVALVAGHEAWQQRQQGVDLYRSFAGCAVVAPLVTMDVPPAPAVALLRLVARLVPHASLPRALAGQLSDRATWVEADLVAWHMTHDTWGVPGGLGWGRPVRWGSAAALLRLSAAVQALLPPAPTPAAEPSQPPSGPRLGRFPVLVLHDPDDEITQFSGSQLLVDRCGPNGTLVAMPGGRHDLFANQPDAVAAELRAFAATAAAAASAWTAAGNGGGTSSSA